jgi:RNA polymerase sigma-70 factor (ECF subfamily)
MEVLPVQPLAGTSAGQGLGGSACVGHGTEDPEIVKLVDRAAAGDSAAFGVLYERFLDPIYRYFYYRTGHPTEAEDLTEQVFLNAWQTVSRFRWQGRPFLAWLYRVAHNLHVNHLRARRADVPLEASAVDQTIVDAHASTQLARTIDADLLRQGIRQLTPEQREVIVLRFAEGLGTPQIAAILDKQEGAIRALQMRAMQRLRQVLVIEEEGRAG